MAVYNPNDPRDYLAIVKEIERLKDARQLVEIKKYHPVQTDLQKAYLNFIITYYSSKVGQTFYQTLSEIQKYVAPHIFETGEYDKQGYPKYKPLGLLNTAEASSVIRCFLDFASSREIMIPDKDDEQAMKYCQREIDSSAGWV